MREVKVTIHCSPPLSNSSGKNYWLKSEEKKNEKKKNYPWKKVRNAKLHKYILKFLRHALGRWGIDPR